MVDGKLPELDITIGERDFTIKQSPGVLQSKRASGTTGAAVWECSVHFAEWLGSPRNALVAQGVLNSGSVALELGAGISGLVPLMLGSRVKQVVATDQQYALGLLKENIEMNTLSSSKDRRGSVAKGKIEVLALDWETDDFANTFRSRDLRTPFDVVVACDCVFNYALIAPFIETCVEACRYAREDSEETNSANRKPALCVVAQQLRQPDVLQEWLAAFLRSFRVWRVPDDVLTEKLREGSGFVVHVGVLR